MLRRVAKALGYTLAVLTVLLALAVGLLRLALPQLPQYQDEITGQIAAAINGDIRFASLDARLRWHGPELVFRDVVIGPELNGQTIDALQIDEITVTVSLSALTFGQRIQIRRIGINGTQLEIVRDAQGVLVQAMRVVRAASTAETLEEAVDVSAVDRQSLPFGDSVDVSIRNISVSLEQRTWQREPVTIRLSRGSLQLSSDELQLNASLNQPDDESAQADLFVSGVIQDWSVDGLLSSDWQVNVDLEELSAKLARDVLPPDWRLPLSGTADVEADAQFGSGTLTAANVLLDADSLEPPDGGPLSSVSGRAEWSRNSTGWLCSVSDFIVGVSDRRWPAASAQFSSQTAKNARRIGLRFDNITVYDLPYFASFLPRSLAETLLATQVDGTLVRGEGFVELEPQADLVDLSLMAIRDYELSLDFVGVGLAPIGSIPGFENITGGLRMSSDTGSLTLDTVAASVMPAALVSAPIPIDKLVGTWVWRRQPDAWSVVSDAIQLQSASIAMRSRFEMTLPDATSVPNVDISADWSVGDVTDVNPWLPDRVLRDKLIEWLRNALVAGRVVDGKARLAGSLDQFPFDDGQGQFEASWRAEDVTLSYGREWPLLTEVSAEVEFDRRSLRSVRNSGLQGRVPFRDAVAAIEDLTQGELVIQAEGQAPLDAIHEFVGATPIVKLLGGQHKNIVVSGQANYALDLMVPLKQVKNFEVTVRSRVTNASFALDYLPFGVSDMQGDVRVDRSGAYADGIRGELLGEPIQFSMQPLDRGDIGGLQIAAQGVLSDVALINDLRLPLQDRLDGRVNYQASVSLPKGKRGTPVEAQRLPVNVSIESTGEGLAIDLPYPVGKQTSEWLPASLSIDILDDITVSGSLGGTVDVAAFLQRSDAENAFQIERATLHFGDGEALLSVTPGLYVDGAIDRLRLGDWLSLQLSEGGWLTDNLTSAAVSVGDLYLFGQRIRDVTGSLQRIADDWLIDVQSPAITGTVSVPTDLNSGAPVVFDMRRLALLESDPLASGETDPTGIPPLRVRAESFALGQREFGRLDATVDKVEAGLIATEVLTSGNGFSLQGDATWLRDSDEEKGSRTALRLDVKSDNVQQMMASLGYSPGVNSNNLTSIVDVSWDGGPGEDFIEFLDGDVSISIVDGTLDEVDPGAGRVLGLISVAELPRRLALDFRDVFRKGFNFDTLSGDFRLVNGEAYTCNLSLQGASADVGIIGRASLFRRNYNQTAIVSVKVGNTLPAVGAVVGGPQVGAVLFLFSQIFKKPLQSMSQIYYQINGSWDEPSIDRTDSDRFVATAELAGCLIDEAG
ncbi:MAG: YhdP family protein [Pseudomonadota bacterium]